MGRTTKRGNINGRLERLEASPVLAAKEPDHDPTTARERLLSDFFRRALKAVGHVRRAPIDEPKWRYTLDGLRGESAVTVAAYTAALANLRHPDEAGARELLSTVAPERGFDASTLWKCVESFVRFAKERR